MLADTAPPTPYRWAGLKVRHVGASHDPARRHLQVLAALARTVVYSAEVEQVLEPLRDVLRLPVGWTSWAAS